MEKAYNDWVFVSARGGEELIADKRLVVVLGWATPVAQGGVRAALRPFLPLKTNFCQGPILSCLRRIELTDPIFFIPSNLERRLYVNKSHPPIPTDVIDFLSDPGALFCRCGGGDSGFKKKPQGSADSALRYRNATCQ